MLQCNKFVDCTTGWLSDKGGIFVTIFSESDDDRPIINLTGLSTKKPDDGKGNHVLWEMTAFTSDAGIVDGSNITGDDQVTGCGEILIIYKWKKLGKRPPIITKTSSSMRVSMQSSNKGCPDKVKRACRKSANRTNTNRGNTVNGCTNDEEPSVIVSSLTKVASGLM